MEKSRIYTLVFSMLVIGFTLAAGFAIVAMERSSAHVLVDTVVKADDAVTQTRSWNDRTIGRIYDEILSEESESTDTLLRDEIRYLQERTQEMVKYIITLQIDLGEYVDGTDRSLYKEKRKNLETLILYPVRVGDLEYLDSYDQPIRFMLYDLDANGQNRASLLKEEIERYKEDILAINDGINATSLGLECNASAGDTWENANFDRSMAANTILILNMLISDVRAAEAEALDELMKIHNHK